MFELLKKLITSRDLEGLFSFCSNLAEEERLALLDQLNARGIKFALSNVLEHKGKENTILKEWLHTRPQYVVNHINTHYANANYQTLIRNKNASDEVLITNYVSKKSF